MILSAQTIRTRVLRTVGSLMAAQREFDDPEFEPLPGELIIHPFTERGISHGRSFGLSCAGYDVRLAENIWVWPLFGRLGSISEYISLPADITAEIKDKSTNARLFVTVQNTTAEPGWRGYLTIEITRHRPWPILLRKGTPIAQVVFKRLDHPTDQPYRGKYQNQKAGPQPAIIERTAP